MMDGVRFSFPAEIRGTESQVAEGEFQEPRAVHSLLTEIKNR